MSKNFYRAVGLIALTMLAAALVADVGGLRAALIHAGNAGEIGLAMAVVTKYGTGARDPSSMKAIEGIFAAAEMRTLVSQIAITNGDSINSVFYIGELPSDAIIDPDSAFDYEAITGVSDIDVGFFQPLAKGGALIDLDNLVDGDNVATAGSQTLKGHATLTTANGHKRVWELAGLSSNPGGNLALGATLKAAATASGVINFRIRYFKGA